MKDRTLLMIPGPIEFEPAVLAALGAPTTSHVAPNFIEVFGQALEKTRQVFLSDDGQPFVLAGSGTLAMDTAVANLIEPGDKALVVNTGFFSDRMAAILERYGAQVTHVTAPVGGRPAIEEVEAALKRDHFKVMSITHVDTSTAVITDVKALAQLAQQYGALSLVDGVCSVAGEELRMSEWGVDVALTASQKAISVPPGLALVVASPRAMQAFKQRKTPVLSYYSDWTNWLPIMEAYEARKPSLLRHACRESHLCAQREPGSDSEGRPRGALQAASRLGRGGAGRVESAGVGSSAAERRIRRAHLERAALS